jgi:hypothetical protein
MKNYINEGPEAVDQSKYKNIDFKDRIVGSSTPSKDKINPSLLADVDKAAGIAGTKGSITTAVTGHKTGSRHNPGGLAVDLAMFDGKGYSSAEDAKSKGIYDKIEKFVKALEGMGYKVNSEKGNDKAVLWFGFPNHHHHVHVSRLSDDGESTSSSTEKEKDSTSGSTEKEKDSTSGSNTDSTTSSSPSSSGTKSKISMFDLMGGGALTSFLDSFTPAKNKTTTPEDKNKTTPEDKEKETQITEEINRINSLIKKVL